MIRACDDHGYFDAEECPVCGDEGRKVLDDGRRTRLSKFVSGALRHFPGDAGLSLDERGWTEYGELVDAVTQRYGWAETEHVEGVVATDSKGRFERRDGRIRAAYGHSVDVELEPTESTVPGQLYHGTAPRNLDAILEDGLRPMSRRHVHLSETPDGAREVGLRHADDPILLSVDADAMGRDGFDIDRRGTGTFTVDRVPPKYIERVEKEGRAGSENA